MDPLDDSADTTPNRVGSMQGGGLPTVALDRQQSLGIPLYVQLRERLRARIQAGEWSPADLFPTEESLSKDFNISRSTVRQALSDLTREGLIVRQPGRGTFVRSLRLAMRMQQFLSFHDEMIERGIRPSSRVLAVEQLGGDEPGVALDASSDEGVIHVHTLRFADGRPVVLFDHYFSATLCAFLLQERLDDPDLSLTRLLHVHGVEMSSSTGEIAAVCATEEEAFLLELPSGSPVVQLTWRTCDSRGRAVEQARALLRTDRYGLQLESQWGEASRER